jgi:hypothetical protein
MSDLVTLEEVKLYDGNLSTASDSVLSLLISAQSQFVQDYTGRDFTASQYTERQGYVASDDTIIPKHSPLVSVQTLTVDGTDIPVSTAQDVPGYRLDGDSIKLSSEYTLGKRPKITIVYTAGVVPDASLKLAVIRLVLLAFKERGGIGTQSQSMSGYTVSYLPAMIPAVVREVLEQHRIKGF